MRKETNGQKSVWKGAALIVLTLYVILSVVTIRICIWLNVLPIAYVVLIGDILLGLVAVLYYLFCSRGAKKKQKKLSRQESSTFILSAGRTVRFVRS